MFKNAIVCKPCPTLAKGLSSASLGIPHYSKALVQHENYVDALHQCGMEVRVLEADPDPGKTRNERFCGPSL